MFYAILCILGSLAAQGYLFYEVGGASREICAGLGTETLVALITTSLLVGLGYCCAGTATRSFLSPAISAVVVVFLSRLTVSISEADHLCAAASLSSDDVVVSAETRERASIAVWVSLALFGLGVLLFHCTALFSAFDCFGCFSDSSSDCEGKPVTRSGRRDYGYVDTEGCEAEEEAQPVRKPRQIWVVSR